MGLNTEARKLLALANVPIDVFLDTCALHSLPTELILAMIEVESNGDSSAMRYEPNYKYIYKPGEFAVRNRWTLATEIELQKFSYGPLQIMGATAREIGFNEKFFELLHPRAGFSWGVLYFSRLCHTHNRSWMDAVSSYNQGSPRKMFMSSKYANQKYVDKVFEAEKKYRG